MKKLIPIIILLFAISVLAQENSKAILVDEFVRDNNDGLGARVDNFWIHLRQSDSAGFVLLSGTSIQKHLNRRRIEGCNYWRNHPKNTLKYIFEDDPTLKVQFWIVPTTSNDPRFKEQPLDYRLTDLDKPFQLANASGLDEYCPKRFDLEWYAKFMNANPQFKGKVIIDVGTKRVFNDRVVKYRKELLQKGIASNRVRYFRRHFVQETDEQWWLIPSRKGK